MHWCIYVSLVTHWPLGEVSAISKCFFFSKHILVSDVFSISCVITLIWILVRKSTLVWVLAWCFQAICNYLNEMNVLYFQYLWSGLCLGNWNEVANTLYSGYTFTNFACHKLGSPGCFSRFSQWTHCGLAMPYGDINQGSGNGLLPDGAKSLPEPIFSNL